MRVGRRCRPSPVALPPSSHTKTLPTISQIRVLDTPHWITRVMAYDRKGREVWSREKNPYLDSEHLVENQLDFVGKVEKSRTTHTKSGTTIRMEDTFTYDHMGRPHTHKINNQLEELIAHNHYDVLGQLIYKEVGGPAAGPGPQYIAYQYNVRGWLKNIDDSDNLGADLFGFEINYNTPRHGAAPLFNGGTSPKQHGRRLVLRFSSRTSYSRCIKLRRYCSYCRPSAAASLANSINSRRNTGNRSSLLYCCI